MKKFSPEPQAFTPQVNSPTEPSSTFDLNKLLQILPKLNLNGLFSRKDNTLPSTQNAPAFTFNPTQNYIMEQNKAEALKTMAKHSATIQRIREENKK